MTARAELPERGRRLGWRVRGCEFVESREPILAICRQQRPQLRSQPPVVVVALEPTGSDQVAAQDEDRRRLGERQPLGAVALRRQHQDHAPESEDRG